MMIARTLLVLTLIGGTAHGETLSYTGSGITRAKMIEAWRKLKVKPLSCHESKPIHPVQVWTQSDDGLTNKLADAIKVGIKHSTHLTLSNTKAPGTLYLNVSPALWRESGDHTRVTYFVKLGHSPNDPTPITTAQGTCWDYQMDRCAAELVATAEAASLGN